MVEKKEEDYPLRFREKASSAPALRGGAMTFRGNRKKRPSIREGALTCETENHQRA